MVVFNAQMAELVDALVSNTNEVTLVPVRLRLWVQRLASLQAFFVFNQFLPIPSQNLHWRLVDDFPTIEPAQYNREEGNHQVNHQTLLPSQTKVQLKDKLAQPERRKEGK